MSVFIPETLVAKAKVNSAQIDTLNLAESTYQRLTILESIMPWLPVAKAVAAMSKDPSTKVGAVAFSRNGNILATGRNGFVRGANDCQSLYGNRSEKYKRIIHAEINLVAQAAREGVSLEGATVLLTELYPCSGCAGAIAHAGVKVVVAPATQANSRWDSEKVLAQEVFDAAGVVVISYTEEDITYGK